MGLAFVSVGGNVITALIQRPKDKARAATVEDLAREIATIRGEYREIRAYIDGELRTAAANYERLKRRATGTTQPSLGAFEGMQAQINDLDEQLRGLSVIATQLGVKVDQIEKDRAEERQERREAQRELSDLIGQFKIVLRTLPQLQQTHGA